MVFDKFGLLDNPFEIKTTSDINDFQVQPFLLTRNQKILKLKTESNINSPIPIYVVLIGDRGIGKSTTLLYLNDCLSKLNQRIYYANKLPISLDDFISIISPERMRVVNYQQSSKDILKEIIRDEKIYVTIDVPDNITPKSLNEFSILLETLLSIKHVSIIISMNRSHYNKVFTYSEILGKYTILELEPLELQETQELIYQRLKSKRVPNHKNKYSPFTEESILKIYTFSNGVPRNILSACDLLLLNGVNSRVSEINSDFTSKILQTDYFSKILNERIKDITLREALKTLYTVIKKHFKGSTSNEKELCQEMSKVYDWANATTRKRLRVLQKIGILEIKKSPKDFWSNQIFLRG